MKCMRVVNVMCCLISLMIYILQHDDSQCPTTPVTTRPGLYELKPTRHVKPHPLLSITFYDPYPAWPLPTPLSRQLHGVVHGGDTKVAILYIIISDMTARCLVVMVVMVVMINGA